MKVQLFSAALLSLAMVIGCESKEETKSAAPAKTAAPAVNPPSAVAPAAPAIPAAPATPAAVDQATAAANTAAADAATQPAASDAQGQLNQVMQYIKDKKFDLADKLLTQLESNKASLPQQVQTQLPNARTALTTAKTANGAAGLIGR